MKKDLRGLRVLITAGPTREYIDPVRFLSNPSTGRMGYALAEKARCRGAEVILITGPTDLPRPARINVIEVVSAEEMYQATIKCFPKQDVTIMTAAVADYRPLRPAKKKLKKGTGTGLGLRLVRTRDILKALGKKKRAGQYLVGFAAETNRLIFNARNKLRDKNLDLIVANQVSAGNAFGSATNQVVVIDTASGVLRLPRMTKERLADRLLNHILKDRPLVSSSSPRRAGRF